MKKWVIAKADTRHDVTSAERDLFRLGEVFVHGTVKDQFSDLNERHELLRPDLRSVKYVELKLVLVGLRDDLNRERPFGGRTVLDGFVEVLAMEIWGDSEGLSWNVIISTYRDPGPQF